MSIGWTGHLRGVQGSDTLRWFTIRGKQIGSDNTGWSMLPISPAGNVLGRQGNDFCKPFFKFWASLTPLSPFPEELRSRRIKILFPLLCKTSWFLYIGEKNNWLNRLTHLCWIIVHNKYWAICPNSTGKCANTPFTFLWGVISNWKWCLQ